MKKYDKIKKIRNKCDVKFHALFDANAFNLSPSDRSAQNWTNSQRLIIHEKISQNSKNM